MSDKEINVEGGFGCFSFILLLFTCINSCQNNSIIRDIKHNRAKVSCEKE